MLLIGQAKGGTLNNNPKGQNSKKLKATANVKVESSKTICKGKCIISISLLNQLFVKKALCMVILSKLKGAVIDPSWKVMEALAQLDNATLHRSIGHVAGQDGGGSDWERNSPVDVFGEEDTIMQAEDDAQIEEQTRGEHSPIGSRSDREILLGLQAQMNEFRTRMGHIKDNQLEIQYLLRRGHGVGPSSSTW
ncbi:unnamed protein product [Ilex paraguariensis]|uniref:Uncharacterized protein n=1 Tax=Ilex paraguariensis TaxID=185542 RepID=A0ABC8TRW0_9AQUA